MTKIGNHPLIGKWRITGMELWDAEFIDMLEPGYFRFDTDGGGQFVFGAVQGGLDCRHAQASLRFTWAGIDEMDEAPAMARPNLLTTQPSQARSASTAAMNPPSPPEGGRFSATC